MDELASDERRLSQWVAGEARGFSRRTLLALGAAVTAAATLGDAVPARAAGPIVKPLPPELFKVLGTNAEMRWESLRDQGHFVPIDRFFVRNHTSTPIIDPATWQLEVVGSGLRGDPATFTLDELRALPAETRDVAVECAGNGRSFFTSQQGETVSGTAWTLGAVGVARWRGVPLRTVLRHAGLSRQAVDVQAEGLDPHYVTGGVDLGPVRRPLPVRKALDDVLLAYEMNGEPLPPDHGFPVRLVVPSWIGIASIKWVGRIEVSAEPLFSPWNTQFPGREKFAQDNVGFTQVNPHLDLTILDHPGTRNDQTVTPCPQGSDYRQRHGDPGKPRELRPPQLATRRHPRRRPAKLHLQRPAPRTRPARRTRQTSGRSPRP
jgi:DMSO/TMAO reductase YedYZ molybdopterin-dependent catalytic subunit